MNLTRKFAQNPFQFLGEYSLNFFHPFPANVTTSTFFTINHDEDETSDEVHIHASGTPDYIAAYYLPFNGRSSPPAHIQIPKRNPLFPFVLTGALSGCSFIVADGGTVWNVYHDPMTNAINLRPMYASMNIVASFEHQEYSGPGQDGGGVAILYYDTPTNKWCFLGQQQILIPGYDRIHVKKRNPVKVHCLE